MSKKHYRRSPSGAKRWLSCPGSLKLSEGRENKSSSYAQEGTRAHDLAEQCLRKGAAAKTLCDDLEMAGAVQEYLDEIDAIRSRVTVVKEETELTVTHPNIDNFGGTPDHFMLYVEDGKVVLHVFDYKHGVGVPVSAEENSQVLSYMVLIGANYLWLPEVYRGTIIQPRNSLGDTVDTWETTPERVYEFEQRILDSEDDTKLCAGDWCRWCPALPICPEVRTYAIEMAQTDFEEIKDDTSKMVELMEAAPAVKALLDRIPKELLTKMKQGEDIPGYKIVERRSHRRWIDEKKISEQLIQLGIDRTLYEDVRVRTPAQLDKELSKEAKRSIEPLYEQVVIGHAVVPKSARGKPVDPVSDDFPDL